MKDGSDSEYNYEFVGLYTIGPDKGDKATFGYDNSNYKKTLIHMEGSDHPPKGVGFDYPYSELQYIASAEGLCAKNNSGNYVKGWEVGASGSAKEESDIQSYLNEEFKPAYDCVYNYSTMILGTSDSINSINSNIEEWRKQKTEDGHLYDRFHIWIDGEYDLYYFNEERSQYEKNNINLLTQLGVNIRYSRTWFKCKKWILQRKKKGKV